MINHKPITQERYDTLLKENPQYASEEELLLIQERDQLRYEAAMERQIKKNISEARPVKVPQKNYPNFRAAWLAHSLKAFKGVLNDVSEGHLEKRLCAAFNALVVQSEGTEQKIDLSSNEALKAVKSVLDNNLYDGAIKQAYLKIRKEQMMNVDGAVSGPLIKKIRLLKRDAYLMRHLTIG